MTHPTKPIPASYQDVDGWRLYDGKYSVTTIIENTVANPKLMSWFKKNSEAKTTKVSEETAGFGTLGHELVAKYLSGEAYTVPETHAKHMASFLEWATINDLKATHTEVYLESESLGYAGTCDFIGTVRGKPFILDWKFSKRFKVTYGAQLAAYRLAAIEMGLVDESCGMAGVQVDSISGVVKHFAYVPESLGIYTDPITGEATKYEHKTIEFQTHFFKSILEVFKCNYFNKLKAANWRWL